MIRIVIIVTLVFSILAGSAVADPISSHYVRVPSKKDVDTADIYVTKINDKEIQVSLEVMAHTPDHGFVRVPRFGVLEREQIELKGNIAIYREPSDSIEHTPCIIVFVFNREQVEVAQFGACDSFGYEVSATGRYVLRSHSGTKK